MRELTGIEDVVAASDDDDLIVWAAQGMKPGVRAWTYGDAVAVAGPQIARGDRLAIRGGTAHAVPLVRHALAEVGPSFRPFGDADVVRDVTQEIEKVHFSANFSWMVTRKAPEPYALGPPAREPYERAGWLDGDDEPGVADLLTTAHPDSYAVPGLAGVHRWAGIRGSSGELLAVAADAWSAPGVGLIAGVATAVRARRRGLGERVCRFLTEALLAEHGRAALMVDDWNDTAIGVYERLGFTRRRVASSRVVTD
ncbi:GNAT family N-acetyltransferase [Sphaerimonospora cavernae]|uniref:GNAT family N-acetyltransferase n=1 Tax=Sphaerimonospora cavernae TaxID=1740611 RepID=A0ABV6UDB7_9ACTN